MVFKSGRSLVENCGFQCSFRKSGRSQGQKPQFLAENCGFRPKPHPLFRKLRFSAVKSAKTVKTRSWGLGQSSSKVFRSKKRKTNKANASDDNCLRSDWFPNLSDNFTIIGKISVLALPITVWSDWNYFAHRIWVKSEGIWKKYNMFYDTSLPNTSCVGKFWAFPVNVNSWVWQ